MLDIPCGTGRLTGILTERMLNVRGADSAPAMIELAIQNFSRYSAATTHRDVNGKFDIADIMNTPYSSKEFNAVVCNRLFHHFTESEVRISALREIRRITSDILVVSFFNSFSLDAYWQKTRNLIRRRKVYDRIPISLKQFKTELKTAGFEFIDYIPVRKYISRMGYIVAKPQDIIPD